LIHDVLKAIHLHTVSQQAGLAFMLAAGAYALARGGRAERLGAGLMLAAWVFTPFLVDLAPAPLDGAAVLAVDAVLLAALFGLALLGDRYWPLASAAFHLVGTVLHIAQIVDPQVALRERIVASYMFSYLTVLALIVGIAMEARRDRDAPPSD
jgi:hypothetical protein